MGSRPTLFVVGAGRVGSSLARALVRAGWAVTGAWTRGQGRRTPGRIRACSGELPASLADSGLVLLAVPDRAVAEAAAWLAGSRLLRRGQVVAHCAGAIDLAPLAGVAAAGARIGSLHPLVAVVRGDTDLSGTFAAVDGDPVARRLLSRAARDAGMRPFFVPPRERVRYHAAASLSANGLVVLADLATELLSACGLSRADALAALLPLLRSSLANLEATGLPGALSGPVARGDAAVVEAHLAALERHRALDAYRALAAGAARLARELGRADPRALRRIEALVRTGKRASGFGLQASGKAPRVRGVAAARSLEPVAGSRGSPSRRHPAR